MAAVKGNEKQKLSFRDIRKYYCEHCGVCRSKKSLIRSHILSQHMDELQEVMLDEVSAFKTAKKVQHACEECGARFWKPAHLLQHMRSHSIEFLQAFVFLIVIYPTNWKMKRGSIGSHDELQNAKRHHLFLDWTSIRMGDLLRSSIMKASIHGSSHLRDNLLVQWRIAILATDERII